MQRMMRRAVAMLGAIGALAAGEARAESKVGVMIDAGVPDGGTAALVLRPVTRVRLSGGVSHNGVGPGVRAGATVAALTGWFTPTVSATYGRFFERDANPMARLVLGDPEMSEPALERFGYQYGDAHVGLEMGRERVTFYVHAGMTRVQTTLHEVDEAGTEEEASVTFTEDPSVTVTTVSARIGLVVYL